MPELDVYKRQVLELAAELEKKSWKGLEAVSRIVLAVLLVVLFGLGIQNYRECYDSYEQQKVETEKTLDLIGTPDEDVNMEMCIRDRDDTG